MKSISNENVGDALITQIVVNLCESKKSSATSFLIPSWQTWPGPRHPETAHDDDDDGDDNDDVDVDDDVDVVGHRT